ncbi:MAG: protein kinase [Rudaea sp.]
MVEIPGFEMRRELGASPSASVYLALQTSLDREVALKVMAQSLASDAAFGQRFLQEARTLASLAHPNIVPVFDVDATESGQHYFSMQYLAGGDFTARVEKGMTDAQLVETLHGVAEALDYVHQRGLVHRDVRPGNILYDSGDAPILTDFGIARAIGASSGTTGTDFSAETGHYMSPEQARGAGLDARADLYSLGALAYFGLTGKPPFTGPDGFAVAYAHVFEPIPRLPVERRHWQALIDRALAKEPAQRFANAREFIDALAAIATPAAASSAAKAPETIQMTVLPAAETPAVAANATVQRPVLPASATPAPRPMPASSAPGAPVQKKTPAEDVGATMQRATPTPKPAKPAHVSVLGANAGRAKDAAAAKDAPRAQARWLPFAVAAAGVAVIGVAIYTQFLRHPAAPPVEAVVATSSAPATAPAPAPVAAPSSRASPPVSPPTDVAATSSASMTSAVPPPPDPTTKAAATDATAIASLDAAAEAGVGEYVPVTDVSALPTVVDPAVEGIRLGRLGIAAQRLTQPVGNNALEFFQFVLKRDAKSKAAKQGIVDIAKKYVELADKSQGNADMQAYLGYLANADSIAKTIDEGADLRKEIDARRAKAAEPYLAQAKAAAAEWNKAGAKTAYEKVLEIDPGNAVAKEGLRVIATIGEPGFEFRDKIGQGEGPDLVILGGGRAAVARHAVTRGEFRRFWNASGRAEFAGKEPSCRDRESFFRSARDRNWQAPGFDQEDNHPVVCISWAEANAFAQWLGRETGKRYRLLTPAEFDQIAARGSECAGANLADAAYNKKFDSRDGANCDDGFAATGPAARYPAGSNVRLWVAACGNGAAVSASCRDHLAKGRSWMSAPKDSATAGDTFGNDVGLNTVGFRVVREIER